MQSMKMSLFRIAIWLVSFRATHRLYVSSSSTIAILSQDQQQWSSNRISTDWDDEQSRHIDSINIIPAEVSVVVSKASHVVDSRFLSVAIDSHLIRKRWQAFDFNSVKLINLASGLSPAILRLGGTDADFMIFDNTVNYVQEHPENTQNQYEKTDHITNFTMSAMDWDNINNFASNVGWDVLFDLNMLLRNGAVWDPTNAQSLLKYNTKRGYRIAAWELGNEPNHIEHHSNMSISARQLGKDFIILRRLLDKYGYQDSFLVGPDVTRPMFTDDSFGHDSIKYLSSFLRSCGNSTEATTWHSYSIDGRNAIADNFTDPVLMDVFKSQVIEIHSLIQKYRPHLSKSWIGETAGAYGGGAPGLSNAYAGGFLWLDKLGVAAANGVDLVFRQSFYSGNYGLLEKKTLNPTPAYWLSYIYKQLVGQVVLSVNVTVIKDASGARPMDGSLPTYIRAYAHCTNDNTRFLPAYSSGSITLFMLNLHKSSAVTLSFGGDLYGKMVDQYILTPHGGNNITATEVDLNGKQLKLTSSDTIPVIEGQPLPRGKPVTLPSLSYGFFVINANASACL